MRKNTMDKTQSINELAVKFLKAVGKRKPNQKHIELTRKLLLTAVVQAHLYFDEKLTEQESNCLLLAAKGLSLDETATVLNITSKTVEMHRRNIMEKLSSSNITQAVFEAIRFGYIQPESKK